MEKTIKHTIQKDEYSHEFYCDDCEEFLGMSEEYDDGWYKKFGEFELKFYVNGKWLIMKKCLCDRCKQKRNKHIEDVLRANGFTG